MRAIVYDDYGPPEVLHLQEMEKPVPKDNEILIKVCATSVNYGDLLARKFNKISPREFNMPFLFWLLARIGFGIKRPKNKILGSEFAGTVESTGKDVHTFKQGDQVFGYLGQNMGAYTEYLRMPEGGCIALKPLNMSYEEATSVPMGSIMALYLLREKGNIQPGQKVLVNGASGSIGSAAVQIAKYYGAEVSGVCGTARLEYVLSLGADKVIDYTKEDFTLNGETYDLIFDVLGISSFSRCKNSLKRNGRYLLASFKMKQLCQMLWTKITSPSGKRVICALAPGSREDLVSVKELIEAGKIRSIIDKSYPMAQVAEAHRYIEEGHARGKIVIVI